MDRERAFAEMVGLLAGLDKSGTVGRGEFDPVLHDREEFGVELFQAIDGFVDANDLELRIEQMGCLGSARLGRLPHRC